MDRLANLDMRPGQIQPNELEIAVLEKLACIDPSIEPSLQRLHVLSRKFTGVGCFTEFNCSGQVATRHLDLDGFIRMPHMDVGLGAVLFLSGNEPQMLEMFTYTAELWDGTYEGFSIDNAA